VGRGGAIVHCDWESCTPVESPTRRSLRAIWGRRANDVWAVGDWGTVLHWDGSSWAHADSGTWADLYTVWGNAAGDLWIGGEAGTILHRRRGASNPDGRRGLAIAGRGPRPITGLSAYASSAADRSDETRYDSGQAIDGRVDTWWQEGAEGDGIGQSLRVSWPEPRSVLEVNLVPGYMRFEDDRTGDRWSMNNRLRRVRLTFSTGLVLERILPDRRGWHTIRLRYPIPATWVEVTILSVYPGLTRRGRVTDSGISEIEILAAR